MGLILKQLFAFIKLLNSDTGNISLAAGMTCGFILGMTPSLSLHSLIIFLLLFLFRIQIGAAFVTAFFFKFIAFLLDPAFHADPHEPITHRLSAPAGIMRRLAIIRLQLFQPASQ